MCVCLCVGCKMPSTPQTNWTECEIGADADAADAASKIFRRQTILLKSEREKCEANARTEPKTYSSSIKCLAWSSSSFDVHTEMKHGAARVKTNSRSMKTFFVCYFSLGFFFFFSFFPFRFFVFFFFFGSTKIEIVLSRRESKNAPKSKLTGREANQPALSCRQRACDAFLFGSRRERENSLNKCVPSFCFARRRRRQRFIST